LTTNFDRRLYIWLTIAFIIATVVGTLTHECGHYLVAKSLGCEASLHYGSTGWWRPNPDQATNHSDSFWILVGGPLETMLTGTIGLALLFLFRKSFVEAENLSFKQWLLIFVSLFWLRQTANFIGWLELYFINGKFTACNDEVRLAEHFNLPTGTISIITAFIGAIVLTVIIFKFVPLKQRLTFIASGLAGALTGYYLWLILLGKYLIL
jgi:hypothetical protein